MSWHAGAALARRIEHAEAANGAICAQSEPGSAVEWFGRACAIFAGAGSPLTHAIGVGMDGPVTPARLRAVERFFASRGASPVIDVCPLGDPGLVELLGKQGYRITEFNNVMGRPVADAAPPGLPGEIGTRLAEPGDEDLWSRLLAQGFLEREDVTEGDLLVGRTLFRAADSACWWATLDGEPAAAGAISTHEGVAMLYADGTHPRRRRRGAHLALIAARLEWAQMRGCDLAAASVLPGSGSQRNYERAGFRVCYTKVVMMADRPPAVRLQ